MNDGDDYKSDEKDSIAHRTPPKRKAMLQRKGTIEPDSEFLGGDDFNMKKFLTRKGLGSSTNIDQVLKSEQKNEKLSHLNWLYEMIS